ncbi:COX15/CtaA family protein [Algoriphagus persicinus]|uniref:COX15/CtaA family protein n=1 Tax=Algoriphagus persicinus TaxID=3108754 RepID=UPI002B3F3F36|nr:COX15/CtaA family protein [Algoriphagus sp. E1-3-M2]MEB2783860.1 COX15/CtaA family protein [Algoriphagus sp. E1-3-M2]
MKQNTNNAINSFRRVSMITVIAVYLLILIGGIVRSSGSGMGCPDWPRCFGNVIPPTSVDQLPVNYQEIYLNKRLAKNERFVATLEKLGFSDKATEIANDKSIYVEEEFNPVKTWIEYLNRLAGVVIGLFIVLTVWKSLPLRKMDGWITILSIFNLILVIFIGWIGSIVVSTNLLHWMITFHMMLALLLVSLLIYVYHRSGKLIPSKGVKMDVPRRIELILLIGTILMLVQVVLGTQVREQIDIISSSLGNMLRDEWVGRVGLDFLIHRSFSLVVLGIHVLYFFWAFKYTLRRSQVNLWSQALMILIILEIATGMGMSYFGIPAFLQPIHLLLGSLIIGAQVILLLEIRENIQFRLNTN